MDNLKAFIYKNKSEIINLLILILFCVLEFSVNFKTRVSLVDYGRELYTPQLLLQGKVLYKDCFMMHPPLSYQINAVLFMLFGTSFKTLLSASFVNICMITVSMYLISKQFIKSGFALSVSFFVLAFIMFRSYSVINYIYPYSYGMVYAVNTFLLAVLFFVKYYFEKKFFYAHLSALFLGIAFACKQEFSILYIPLFVILLKTNWKTVLFNLFCFCIVPLLSWGVLFAQGMDFGDILSFLAFQKSLVKTKCWYFFTYGTDEILPVQFFKRFCYGIAGVLLGLGYFTANTAVLKKLLCNINLKKYILVFILALLNLFILMAFSELANLLFLGVNLPLIYFCYKACKNKDDNFLLFLFLTVLCLLVSVRECLTPLRYGIYAFILPMILNFVFVFQSKLRDDTTKALKVFLFIVSFLMLLVNTIILTKPLKELKTSKGDVYMLRKQADVYADLINWIEQNTGKTDKILMLPESPVINFMTERPSDDFYYQLSPDHVEALTEEKIISDLKNRLPQYVMIQTIKHIEYGVNYLGEDYGSKITEFVLDNYDFVKEIKKDDFGVIILKRK